MSEDIDSSISLNLFNPTQRSISDESQTKTRITGNRGKRIKLRKSLKRQRENQQQTVDEHVEIGTSVPSRDSEGSGDEGKHVKRQKHTAGKPVFSSLFTSNPEIPEVERSKVHTVKETLFSSGLFKDVPLHPYMISNLEKLGFSTMTAVQQHTIPKLLEGKDVLVKSQTGSGKTMAYAIPVIQDLQSQQPRIQRINGPVAMVIVPTRELAEQSYETFQKLLQPFMWLVPGCIKGGEKRKAEKARLRKGINILVSTPGRLLDHIEHTKTLLLDRIRWLILDEADRLLDMGYEKDVSKIISAIDSQGTDITRQTVLLSATLSEGVERLAGMSLKTPERVTVTKDNTNTGAQSKKQKLKTENQSSDIKTGNQSSSADDTFALPENLQQYFVITPCKLRLVTLLTFVMSKYKAKSSRNKIIVFISTQDSVELHYRLLQYLLSDHQSSDVELEGSNRDRDDSLSLFRLHGDMSQQDRTNAYRSFSSCKTGVLLCTDVAARGLHLPYVDWVVQYCSPTGFTDYVHRVGRTARVGSSGQSVLFLLPTEADYVKCLNEQNISLEEMKIGDILQDALKLVPYLPEIDSQKHSPHTPEEAAIYLQRSCEHLIMKDNDISVSCKKAYQSYVRAYATYPSSLKHIFHVRHLHLGHVAKSFALQEAPSNISGVHGLKQTKGPFKRKQTRESSDRPFKRKRPQKVSEFTSSLVFTSKKKISKGRKKKSKA